MSEEKRWYDLEAAQAILRQFFEEGSVGRIEFNLPPARGEDPRLFSVKIEQVVKEWEMPPDTVQQILSFASGFSSSVQNLEIQKDPAGKFAQLRLRRRV